MREEDRRVPRRDARSKYVGLNRLPRMEDWATHAKRLSGPSEKCNEIEEL